MSTQISSLSTDMFAKSDALDVAGWTDMLTEDVRFQFGNGDEILGRANVREVITGFFESIAGLKHDVTEEWRDGDTLIQRMTVTYTRHDGSNLTLPAANILRLRGDQISDYQIYVDNSALYA